MQTQRFATPHIPPVPRRMGARAARPTPLGARDAWMTEASVAGLVGLALAWGAAELAWLLGG